jgi:hypothetical protein
MCSVPIREFCALKSKMYSLSVEEPARNKKVAKGVSRTFVKHHLAHSDYVGVLTSGEPNQASSLAIRSSMHQLYTMAISKKALDSNDSKRIVLRNGIDTLPFGHRLLGDVNWCRENLPPPPEQQRNVHADGAAAGDDDDSDYGDNYGEENE